MYGDPHAQAWALLRALERKKKSRPKKEITSGSKLIDGFFIKVINALNYEVEGIFLVKSIREKPKGSLSGLYTVHNEIYLSAAKCHHKDRMEIARTLLHEGLHVAFSDFSEEVIYALENDLWSRLHQKQKLILASYVPKVSKRSIVYDE